MKAKVPDFGHEIFQSQFSLRYFFYIQNKSIGFGTKTHIPQLGVW